MDIGRSQFIVLRSPHPFLAALLSCKTEKIGSARLTIGSSRIIGNVQRLKLIHSVRQIHRNLGAPCGLGITSPVQIYLSLESISSRTPDTASSPLRVRPLDRKIVQKFVRNVREDPVNDFLLRSTPVFVVCQ